MTSGVGSTGDPIERSTMPSGCARARAAYGRDRIPGIVGQIADAHDGYGACGGSASMTGWSLWITPTLAAPPGDPTSSKNSTLAL